MFKTKSVVKDYLHIYGSLNLESIKTMEVMNLKEQSNCKALLF